MSHLEIGESVTYVTTKGKLRTRGGEPHVHEKAELLISDEAESQLRQERKDPRESP